MYVKVIFMLKISLHSWDGKHLQWKSKHFLLCCIYKSKRWIVYFSVRMVNLLTSCLYVLYRAFFWGFTIHIFWKQKWDSGVSEILWSWYPCRDCSFLLGTSDFTFYLNVKLNIFCFNKIHLLFLKRNSLRHSFSRCCFLSSQCHLVH